MANIYIPLVPATIDADVVKVNGLCYQFIGFSSTVPGSTPDEIFDTCAECEEAPTPTPTPTPSPTPSPTPTIPTPTPSPTPTPEPTPSPTPTPTPTPAPSTDCTDCAANCDGAASMTLVVSGFSTGGLNCTNFNGTYTLNREVACSWAGSNGNGATARVSCTGDKWKVQVWSGGFSTCFTENASMVCSGDHPTGSGGFEVCNACTTSQGTWTAS